MHKIFNFLLKHKEINSARDCRKNHQQSPIFKNPGYHGQSTHSNYPTETLYECYCSSFTVGGYFHTLNKKYEF